MLQVLLLIFIIVPIIEIYLLIQIGSAFGAGWTVVLVVFTAVLGAYLVRAQGFSTFMRVQQSMDRGEMPAIEMLEGVILLIAGALLLTPGFFTDALGFAALVPPLRRKAIQHFIRRGGINFTSVCHGGGQTGSHPRSEDPLDGDYKRLDD